MILVLAGCVVDVARDGLVAVAVADRFRPDVCILDIRLPGVDGLEVARRLRTRAGESPLLLVAVTGLAVGALRGPAAAAGFDCLILKPASPDDVQTILAAFASASRAGSD